MILAHAVVVKSIRNAAGSDIMTLFFYFLTSLLYIFSFPNFDFSWLAYFCLVPLIIAVDKEKELIYVVRKSLLCGWMIFLVGMFWITNVTVLGWILLTFYMAWFVVLFAIIRFYNKKIFIIPFAWTALEFTRGNLLGGIPWLLLGASQHSFLPLIQISNITGVYGISFIVALINAGIVDAAKKKFFGLFIGICFAVLIIFYGRAELNKYIHGEIIGIGIVQPDVSQDVKWDPKSTNWMMERLEALTKQIEDVDLIIWPETAIPILTEDPNLLERVSFLTKKRQCDLIVGSQAVGNNGEKKYYNSAFFVSREGKIMGKYSKIHLVPFGEFVPFSKTFPFLKAFTPIDEGFTPGNEYTIFNLSTLNFQLSTLICFEDIFPNLARRFVKHGADMLVNITNDGWFGKTNAVYQHAYLSVFRAIENGVPLIRCTNTGLSCFIESTGELHLIKPFAPMGSSREMLVSKKNTLYTKYGDVFGWFCVLALLFIGGINVRRIKKRPV